MLFDLMKLIDLDESEFANRPESSGDCMHFATAYSAPSAPLPVDVVDVFRRSELLPGHLQEILAMRPLPRWVWLQSGVYHDEVTRELEAHGIAVVQDRCMLADHRAFGLPPRS